MANRVVERNKLDNGYWQITVLDAVTKARKQVTEEKTGLPLEFYQVDNQDIKLKNYPYIEVDDSYIYFEKKYTPMFIAELIYLFVTFAKDNDIKDNDMLKIDSELTNQGYTLSKYGIYKINMDTVYPCLKIDPYPEDLHYACEKYNNNVSTNNIYMYSTIIISIILIIYILYNIYISK